MPLIPDAVDYAILAVLQAEGRIPIVELSKRVHLSATPCTLRIRALEQDGLICGYHAVLDAKALGRALLVFVQVKLKATDEATLAAFKAAITPVEQVLECHMVGGGFDFLLKLRVADMQEYRDILGGMIGALPMVENTHSYFVMEEVKETHMLPLPKPQKRR